MYDRVSGEQRAQGMNEGTDWAAGPAAREKEVARLAQTAHRNILHEASIFPEH